MKDQAGLDRRTFVKGALGAGLGTAALSMFGCAPGGGSGSEAPEKSSIEYPGLTSAEDFENSAVSIEAIAEFSEEKTYDIVVVGAGTSGLPAALTALEEGASVACLQKEDKAISQGGSSTGIVVEASTELGIKQFKQKYRQECSWRLNHDLLDTWVNHSGETILWMCEKATAAGYPPYLTASQEVTYENDESVVLKITNRFGPKPENNGTMIVKLAEYAEKQGVEMFYSTPGVQLVADESGAVVGVVGEAPDGSFIKFNANKAVILATGDYQNNTSLVEKYSPDLAGFQRKQSNKTGDGILMSMLVGGHMVPVNHSRQMHDIDSGPMTDEPFLAVGEDGKRFMNEQIGMDHWNCEVRWSGSPGNFCQIFDSSYVEQVTAWGGKPTSKEDIENFIPGAVENPKNVIKSLIDTHRCDTLDELAGELGIPADALKQSVERYNELCAQGVDVDFGKEARYLQPVVEPPFYGIHKHIRITAICGGIAVDGNYQVVDEQGLPIPGLYAVGFGAGDLCGAIDWSTYVTGMSNGSCMNSGRCAALHAVRGTLEPSNPVQWADYIEQYGAGSALGGVFH